MSFCELGWKSVGGLSFWRRLFRDGYFPPLCSMSVQLFWERTCCLFTVTHSRPEEQSLGASVSRGPHVLLGSLSQNNMDFFCTENHSSISSFEYCPQSKTGFPFLSTQILAQFLCNLLALQFFLQRFFFLLSSIFCFFSGGFMSVMQFAMLLEIELNYCFSVLLYFCYLSILTESVFLLPIVFLLELRLCPVCVFSNTTRQLSCDCLRGGSIRSYWLMLSPIRLPSPHPLQSQSPGLLTKLEVPTTPFLSQINLPKQLTELREAFHLVDYHFIIKDLTQEQLD